VPLPTVSDLGELNRRCGAADLADDTRRIGARETTIGEDFAEERVHLLTLPREPFDTASLLECRVDTKARVCVRQCFYSVPARLAGRHLPVRLGATTVEVLDGSMVVASHQRSAHKGDDVLVLDHYLEVLRHKPGALAGASALGRARADGSFTATHERFWADARRRLGDALGTRALVDVPLLHRRLPAAQVVAGMAAALEADSVDPKVVAVEARRAAPVPRAAVVAIGALARFDRPAPALIGYDTLLSDGMLADGAAS
jgi:Mu transposase-like protein